jgi:hypothetical protein
MFARVDRITSPHLSPDLLVIVLFDEAVIRETDDRPIHRWVFVTAKKRKPHP